MLKGYTKSFYHISLYKIKNREEENLKTKEGMSILKMYVQERGTK